MVDLSARRTTVVFFDVPNLVSAEHLVARIFMGVAFAFAVVPLSWF